MSGIIYYVVDTETNGLKVGHHEITQISVIRCEDKIQISRDIAIDFPERSSEEALKITNKTIKDLKKGISKKQAIEIFDSFFSEDEKTSEHRCVIAHNANFDKRHLHSLWASQEAKFPADLWLDSKELARAYAKRKGIIKPKLDLGSVLKMAGLNERLGAHNATIDTQNTYFLWKKMMDDNIDHLPLIKREPHITDSGSSEFYDPSEYM